MFVDDETRLRHIFDVARRTVRFARGRTRADLDGDEMFQGAVLHGLMIIGEAASKVTAERRAREPGVEWQKMIGLRNRLIRDYPDARSDVVWDTVHTDLAALVAHLERTLPPWSDSGSLEPGR